MNALNHAPLILKRASLSRPSGEGDDDDFNVLADGVVVGRIFNSNAGPVGSPWMWTLAFGCHEGPHADPRQRGDARGRDGGVRKKLAAGMRWTGRTACARSVLFCSVSQ
jgi:hypothetical protein